MLIVMVMLVAIRITSRVHFCDPFVGSLLVTFVFPMTSPDSVINRWVSIVPTHLTINQ